MVSLLVKMTKVGPEEWEKVRPQPYVEEYSLKELAGVACWADNAGNYSFYGTASHEIAVAGAKLVFDQVSKAQKCFEQAAKLQEGKVGLEVEVATFGENLEVGASGNCTKKSQEFCEKVSRTYGCCCCCCPR